MLPKGLIPGQTQLANQSPSIDAPKGPRPWIDTTGQSVTKYRCSHRASSLDRHNGPISHQISMLPQGLVPGQTQPANQSPSIDAPKGPRPWIDTTGQSVTKYRCSHPEILNSIVWYFPDQVNGIRFGYYQPVLTSMTPLLLISLNKWKAPTALRVKLLRAELALGKCLDMNWSS